MTNNEFGKTFELRTKKFSIAVIRLSSSLNNSQEAGVLRNQLSKSATSVGANYREANRSRSNNDFKHKIKICKSTLR
jgi:four helix bundle protein